MSRTFRAHRSRYPAHDKKGYTLDSTLDHDAIMRKCFKKGGKVNNPEDVRGFCDDCFASMNGNPLAQDFRYGFWAAGDSGKALGKEVWALSLLYPLVLAGNSFLLDDEPIRKKLLQYSALILSLSGSIKQSKHIQLRIWRICGRM